MYCTGNLDTLWVWNSEIYAEYYKYFSTVYCDKTIVIIIVEVVIIDSKMLVDDAYPYQGVARISKRVFYCIKQWLPPDVDKSYILIHLKLKINEI